MHDFSELYSHYPALIEQMPETFTSHEFILRLAQRHQQLYIEALYSYRDALHRGGQAPFMIVHGILAKQLSNYPTLIEHIGDVMSVDIFGQQNGCARWRRRSSAA